MEPDIRQMSEKFGSLEYQNITNIHPLAIVAVVVLGILLVVVPRRWSIFPMLIITCFISSVQKISILEIDFDLLRIMVLFGVARLIIFREYIGYKWIPLDTVMALWTISSMVIYILQQGTFSAFVNRLGFGFDAYGMYFLFRCLIKDWLDVDRIIMGFILISIPVAAFFVLEKGTGHNVFSVFGGVPAITIVREGKARCQGAFSHPIIAGCFWASLVPLLVTYWWKSAKDRIWATIGLFASFTIVVCCASSTPVMGVFAAIIGGLFFVFHRQMRVIRWTVLLLLVVLHMVMEAPVWHLISRVSAVGGSTGYFRYQLIDNAIRHFAEWAILGTKSTAHWFWGAQDLCNQYILVGVEGGFLTLCFFVIVIAVAFCEIGRLWRSQSLSPYRIALSWAMGVSLFVHCMNFIGVSYFGQIWLIWYLLLAMIGSLSCGQTYSVPKIQSSSLMKKGRYQNR
jgi:hypothetical protein